MALSRRTPGVLWSHNDSPDPVLFALDLSGAIKARVQVTGAKVTDWEDVAAGSCARGDCLYIADIGDNNAVRPRVTIYRVPEPRTDAKATEPAEAIDLVYPDGPHDAEALFTASNGQLFIVTKESATATALYRVPQDVQPGAVGRLEVVSRLPLTDVTGASANGDWVALRTNRELFFYRLRDLVSGSRAPSSRMDLTMLREPQGEGVALGANGVVYLVGERGGGTFAKLQCRLP